MLAQQHEQLVANYQEAIHALTAKISAWIKEHALFEGLFDGTKMKALVNFIGDSCREDVDACARLFKEWEDFPGQPYALVYGIPGSRDMVPDVYLMGWRPCDTEQCQGGRIPEGTVIHDHGISQVAIRVIRGAIREVTYSNESEHSSDGHVAMVTRVLHAGESVVLSAPVIHDVHSALEGAEAKEVIALTAHIYWPPLDHQVIYEARGGTLVPTGTWDSDNIEQ